MLESILIIWLSIGLVISLTTFLYTIYIVNNLEITLEDLFAFLISIINGPLLGIYLLIEKFVHMDDIVIFKHYRQEE